MFVSLHSWTKNKKLIRFIQDAIALCCPKHVHFCDGSEKEARALEELLVKKGTFIPLKKREGSFLARSDPEDVARVEEVTIICSEREEDAGPTNHWEDPQEAKKKLRILFSGSMRGRTLYVIPYILGPLGSPHARFGVEITDSPYVVLNMRIMTQIGEKIRTAIGPDTPFVPGLHSVGVPLEGSERDVAWPCRPSKRVIAHFPEEYSIYSYGSGYGGNALLGKKCFALRIASVMAKKEKWMAEHMLIMSITNPHGEKKYFAAAFPSACGKTNLALLKPSLPGWHVECIGDDIAWLFFGEDGRLWAINPEAGMFGVAPGTSLQSNPHVMQTIAKNTIFTNVALTEDGDVWWEGMTKEVPKNLTNWRGVKHDPKSKETAAHPNSRFTAPLSQCPIFDATSWASPKGIPISAIIFGGRRSDTVPLVMEAFSWNHGVFLGAAINSERTAAAAGEVGTLRHDPFAMLPFCGYNMGDYFHHWLEMGKNTQAELLPKIFYINWFRKKDNALLWPGYGENIRVLEWIFSRTANQVEAQKTAIGNLPKKEDLNLSDLNVDIDALLRVDKEEWQKEIERLRHYFTLFKDQFPTPLMHELNKMEENL